MEATLTTHQSLEVSTPTSRGYLLSFLVLISGFCGISYEILFGRILSNLAGDQFTVSGSILLTFLLGLGFGAILAHRLWHHLWLIEAGIGICGVAFALGTPWMDQLLYFQDGALLPLCVGLLLLPSFLIGASLPIFAGWMRSIAPAATFSRSYSLYNFGAAIMVLVVEFWLVRQFGLKMATLFVASINAVISILLLIFFRTPPVPLPSPRRCQCAKRLSKKQLLPVILAGIASAIFQLTMLRVAECLLGPFRETFAFVLSLILLGIALGSLCVRRLYWSFPLCMLVNLLALIWLLAGLPQVMKVYAAGYEECVRWPLTLILLKIAILASLMLVPAMGFGATIPALLGKGRGHVAKKSGRLLFYTSLANATGFGLMVSWLHLKLDYGNLLLTVIILAGLALLLGPGNRLLKISTPLLLLSAVIVHRALWDEGFLYLGHEAFRSPQSLEAKWAGVDASERYKGRRESFSITRYDGSPYFFTNGFISIPLHAPSEKLVGAFAGIHAPRTDRALVLGIGSGATAGTTGKLFQKTDAVEINQAVLDNLHRMKEYNFDMEVDPNIRIIHDDGVHFIKSGDERYPLIINTVTNPLYFSSSKLYTTDFYDIVKKRMTPDGIYATSFDSTIGEEGVDIMLHTALSVFKHVAVGCIKGNYYTLLCSDQPVRPHHPRLVADHPWMGRFFHKEYDLRPDWLPYSLIITDAAKLLADTSTPLNTLDKPVLEFAMARLASRGYPAFSARIESNVNPESIAHTDEGLMIYNPLHHLLYLESLTGDSPSSRGLQRHLNTNSEFATRFHQAEQEEVEREAFEGDSPTVFFRYGNKLKNRGEYENAIKQFNRVLELNSSMILVYIERGACYEYLGQFDRALDNYDKIYHLTPEDPEAIYRIGRVYVKQSRYSEAIAMLRRARQLRPKDLSIQMYLEQAEEAAHAREGDRFDSF